MIFVSSPCALQSSGAKGKRASASKRMRGRGIKTAPWDCVLYPRMTRIKRFAAAEFSNLPVRIRGPMRAEPAKRCATNSWVSAGLGRASLPEFLPAATHPATAQGDDGVGAPDGPVHSGALESLSNDRFTARLDDARPDE